jgi:hypothetical protein
MSSLFSKQLLGVLVAALLSIVSPQPAKAYQVDCAILLCLAGGWPASAECAHARAVFIRRITPWPIEPQNRANPAQIILAQLAEGGGADIDIIGFEFDFVRSIRVWDVRHYSHRERGRDDDCSERYSMNLGTYGTQGDFNWQRTTPASAPTWVIPSRRCSSSSTRRGGGVEWEDHQGNHGYEWVAY